MKKLLILLISFLAIINSCYCITIFDNNINDCINVSINVNSTLQIDNSEYNLSNCEMQNSTFWNCDCNIIELTTKSNTINNYTFQILVNYYTQTYTNSHSRGSTYHFIYPPVVVDTTNYTIENKTIVNETINTNFTNTDNYSQNSNDFFNNSFGSVDFFNINGNNSFRNEVNITNLSFSDDFIDSLEFKKNKFKYTPTVIVIIITFIFIYFF